MFAPFLSIYVHFYVNFMLFMLVYKPFKLLFKVVKRAITHPFSNCLCDDFFAATLFIAAINSFMVGDLEAKF